MNLYDFLAQFPDYMIFIIFLGVIYLVFSIFRKGFSFTSGKIKLNTIDNAMIIEKIIEIAYAISYLESTKKIRSQMIFFEKKVEDVINNSIKKFKKLLLLKLEKEEEEIFSLEHYDDLEVFKNGMEVVRVNWRSFVREFFREEINEGVDKDYDDLKVLYLRKIEKIRIETLNKFYRDSIGDTKRVVLRNDIYLMFKADEVNLEFEFLETFNNALLANENIRLEKERKIKELENYLKGKTR